MASHIYSDPNAGTKRLFSSRESRAVDTVDAYGENTGDKEETGESHSGKRHRTSDWPLSNTTLVHSNAQARPPLRNRNAPNSPNHRRSSANIPRPSKFVEGSMNDRVSYKPPEPYIGNDEEELMTRYGRESASPRKKMMTLPRKFTQYPNASTADSSASKDQDAARSSGIFRFGKSLAASFNPTNWKIWQKPQEVEAPEQKMLRERKEKAEKMYKELKDTGLYRDATVGQQSYYHLAAQMSGDDSIDKHDSGVQFGYEVLDSKNIEEMSKAEKRMGRVFLEPQKFGGSQRADSVSLDGMEDKRSIRQPSLSDVQNSESPASHRSASEHKARRIPSRKDMQKQQKLVKRVSNLENKLDAARRQLAEALSNHSTSQHTSKVGKSLFTPGGLASLPSERLLSAHLRYEGGLDDEEDGFEGIGKALTTDELMNRREVMSGSRVNSAEPDLDKPLPPIVSKPYHADRLIRSVESDYVVEEADKSNIKAARTKQLHQAPTTNERETSYNPSQSFFEDEETSQEPTPKPKPTLRKRKSIVYERTADDSTYKPSETPNEESTNELDSTPKKLHLKKPSIPRPRKLQKTSQKQSGVGETPVKEPPSTPDLKAAAPQNQHQPASRYKGPHNENQNHHKPSTSPFKTLRDPPRLLPSQTSFSNHNHEIIIDDELDNEQIPPVPRLPQTVHLPSGEVVRIPHSSPGRTSSKITKKKPATRGEQEMKVGSGEGRKRALDSGAGTGAIREEFEWDEDVF